MLHSVPRGFFNHLTSTRTRSRKHDCKIQYRLCFVELACQCGRNDVLSLHTKLQKKVLKLLSLPNEGKAAPWSTGLRPVAKAGHASFAFSPHARASSINVISPPETEPLTSRKPVAHSQDITSKALVTTLLALRGQRSHGWLAASTRQRSCHVPAAHSSHWPLTTREAKEPGAHSRQVAADTVTRAAEYVPVGHCRHSETL